MLGFGKGAAVEEQVAAMLNKISAAKVAAELLPKLRHND